jgi:hypothetical protein
MLYRGGERGRTSIDPTQLLEELRQDDDSESLLDRLLLGLESLSESETFLVISGFVTPFARQQTVLCSYHRTSVPDVLRTHESD